MLVDPRVGGERRDETDVRTLWGLDRADAAVVGRVYVADLEARALAGQAPRSEGRETTLVRDLGERVGLVHELGELRAPEELLDHGRDRLGVDQVVRHQVLDFLQAHALLDGALHPDQADAVLVLQELAHGADAAVAEVVDVVDVTLAVFQLDQVAHHLEDVLAGERHAVKRHVHAELVVQLQAADRGEVVALGVEEQVLEQDQRALQGRRIARTQPPVDLDQRLVGGADLVDQDGVAEAGGDVQVVDEEHLEGGDPLLDDLLELRQGEFLVALGQDLAGSRVVDVVGGNLADDLLLGDRDLLDAVLGHLADGRLGELAVRLEDHLAGGRVDDVGGRLLVGQKLGVGQLAHPLLGDPDLLGLVEVVDQRVVGVAEALQQHGGRHLATPVYAHIKDVFMVKFKIKPRAAVRDDASGVEHLAAGVGLTLVVVVENARRAVQLGNDDALRAVYDKGPVVGHQRDFAEIDLLLLDVAYRTGTGVLGHIPDYQPHLHLHRGRERHPALVALFHVVLGRAKRIRNVLKRGCIAEVPDREDAAEHGLKAGVLACVYGGVELEESLVGIFLDVDEVRYVDDLVDLGEVLAQQGVIRD